MTEGFFWGLNVLDVSLLKPAAFYVNAQPVILDLNSCMASIVGTVIFRYDITNVVLC